MFRSTRIRLAVVAAVATMSLGVAAGPASAAQQQGLVNLGVSGNTVQVPIGIAANVCDVNVAVLVNTLLDQAQPCMSDAAGDAFVTSPPGGGGQSGDQSGLVNVIIDNNTVQIPLAVALNVCDVNVAVLTALVNDQAAPCDARARSHARN